LIAITGVAGTRVGEDGNPVGLVYVAVASRDGTAKVVEHRLGNGPKGEICRAAMRSGISLLEEFIRAQRP
jgi:nicotinamide mononucleotide (NMN) deamidase PncC